MRYLFWSSTSAQPAGHSLLPGSALTRRRRAAFPLCILALPALAALAAIGSACAKSDVTQPPPGVTAAPTKLPPGEPATGGSGPPVPQNRQLPGDTTGGTSWGETTAAGATWRAPWDDREWELSWDQGVSGTGFAGLPYIRVTHLATGQTRFYSLVTGDLILCTRRSGLPPPPTPTGSTMRDNGIAVDCAAQALTPQERAVFGHVRVTGTYDRYDGPLAGEPTFPGLVLPTAPPSPLGATPVLPPPNETKPAATAEPATGTATAGPQQP